VKYEYFIILNYRTFVMNIFGSRFDCNKKFSIKRLDQGPEGGRPGQGNAFLTIKISEGIFDEDGRPTDPIPSMGERSSPREAACHEQQTIQLL
jgi:hypothetical protein